MIHHKPISNLSFSSLRVVLGAPVLPAGAVSEATVGMEEMQMKWQAPVFTLYRARP